MKSLLIGIILAISLTTSSLFAKDLNISACTNDYKKVLLTIDFKEEAGKVIEDEIKAAFTKTANRLTVDELINGEGFRIFMSYLTEEDYDAITGIAGPPTIDGTCGAV